MSRPSFPERVERGGLVARAVLDGLFRVFVFALFAPAAWRALLAGDWLSLALSLLCGFGIGALLAPRV